MLGAPADLLSLLYLIAAAFTLWQLPSRWRALTDDEYTTDDKNLAGRVGFLLLTPVGVLIHELSHMAAATLLGGRDITLSFRFYWGFVTYRGQLGPAADWVIASAGPLSSLLLGLAVGFAALRLRQPWRDAGLSFAHATLLLDLILYPGMSLVDGVGDFRYIYTSQVPALSVAAGVVHALGLIAYIVMTRQQTRQARREARAALTERFSGQQVTLRPEVVARLSELEAAERVRRLEPDEREELNHLRELRDWSEEHNQGIAAVPPNPGPPDPMPPRLPPPHHQQSASPPDVPPLPPSNGTAHSPNGTSHS